MSEPWLARLRSAGFQDEAAQLAAAAFARVAAVWRTHFGEPDAARAWWVPGRIEVLGKHTDYGGGRSLICAVERGLHLLAVPRRDGVIRVIDASTGAMWTGAIRPDLAPAHGEWFDYPLTVARRIARDFPGSTTGMDAVFLSTIPRAAGLSSSSALVIAAFLPLAAFNQLREHAAWRHLPDTDAVAGYLGAMENGLAFAGFEGDFGVGTHGGSEDHTAILCSRAGELACYHYLPVTHEASVALPDDWAFVVASSGVQASKAGSVRQHYNELSRQVRRLAEVGRTLTGRPSASLYALVHQAPEVVASLGRLLPETDEGRLLRGRLDQFVEECEEIIPTVLRQLAAENVAGIREAVSRSHALAVTVLCNQIPETMQLAESALAMGAVAASAFGAGFGGSVWALVPSIEAATFRQTWREGYRLSHPERAHRSEFFVTRPGPGALELPT